MTTGSEQIEQNKKLDVFIGKWHTKGEIFDIHGAVVGKVDAIDTYEWLPGQYAMIHYADSNMGDDKIHAIEIIGYDPARKAYFGPFFDDHGGAGQEEISTDGKTWTWYGENVMGVKYHRCNAVFTDDNTITALHEFSDDGQSWHEWMPIALTRM